MPSAASVLVRCTSMSLWVWRIGTEMGKRMASRIGELTDNSRTEQEG